jgi:hypothetical protein
MKTPINEQFIKMQKLAGVITESQYVTELRNLHENRTPEQIWDDQDEETGLDFEIKSDLVLGDLDGAEDVNRWANTKFQELTPNMQDAIEDYLKKNGMIEETPRPNAYSDDAANLNRELEDFPFDTDEENMFTEAKKSKMTKTELKEAIRQEILAALTEDNLTEAEDEEEEEIALDAETEETPADDTEAEPDDAAGDTTNSQDVQKELTDALEAAKKLGDKKLVRQIGNALTYFTRQQISSEEEM